jgi:DNA-binding transcriptional LysR family regulator
MLSRTLLRQFLAVVDAGSFTRAAARINIAQPTLSAGIAELERQLGAKLFVRERHRIRLTEAGNRLLPHARAIERGFRLAETSASDVPPLKAAIRLGVIASFATAHLERAVAAFAGAEPLEIAEGSDRELRAMLANGSLDCALTLLRANERHPGLVLFSEPYRLALPDRHALASEESVDAAAVAGETMIARRSCELLSETSRFFTERGVRPPFSLRSANDDRVMAMVRAGLGITIAPMSLAVQGICMPKLREFDHERHIGFLIAREGRLADADGRHPLLRAFG